MMAIQFPSALESAERRLTAAELMVPVVVNVASAAVVANKRSKDRHNKDRRRAYMRTYMAARRAKK